MHEHTYTGIGASITSSISQYTWPHTCIQYVYLWHTQTNSPSRHSGATNAGVPAYLDKLDSVRSISSDTPKSAIWIQAKNSN